MFARKTTARLAPALSSNPASKLLDMVLPHTCGLCREVMNSGQSLCADCWGGLQFIARPHCDCCGLPFAFDLGPGALCAKCVEKRPSFTAARAALKYDDHSKQMILAFKHGDKIHLRGLLAKFLYQSGKDVLQGANLIAPVPLHWWRMVKRKYNQAALLSSEIANYSGLDHEAHLLLRKKRTVPHENMSRDEREKNVSKAFTVNPKYVDSVKGKIIVLVDDVMTSGATVNECAKTLLKQGVAEVRVLTLARVVFDS